MPERDRALFLAGPAAGGTSICGMGGKVKALYRLWVDNRDEILAEFIKTHPGRRPRGFWLADAPPGGFDYLAEETAALTAQGGQPPHESQASFLRRHRLLMRGELERLTEDDFKPEAAVVIAYHQRGERLFGESIGLA